LYTSTLPQQTLFGHNAPFAAYAQRVFELTFEISFRTLDRYLAWLSMLIQCSCLSLTKAKVGYPTYEQTALNARVSHGGELLYLSLTERPFRSMADPQMNITVVTMDAYLVNPAYPVDSLLVLEPTFESSETT
jgi:hypothetical protein